MMRVLVLFNSPTRASKSFVQMHQWHSDLLHCGSSTRCNSRWNHCGSSEISPRYLHGEVCSLSYGTYKWWAPHPDSHDAFSQWQEILSHDAGKIYRCQSSVTYAFTLPSVTCPWTQPCTQREIKVMSARDPVFSLLILDLDLDLEKTPKSWKRESMRVGD